MSENEMKEFDPTKFLDNINNQSLAISLAEFMSIKSILGIDIYKYSQYEQVPQILVPVLFDHLYRSTCYLVATYESFFFSHASIKEFQKDFISTGDGGYQIFDNPIQALIFAIYFQVNTKRYLAGQNTVPFASELFKMVKSLDLRYVITHGDIYKYHNIFYGESIINNARILSKDNLNRLLIDQSSVNWFIQNINSVENLLDIKKDDLLKIPIFKENSADKGSYLFELGGKIVSVDILKIGNVLVKSKLLNIYNLHVQAITQLEAKSPYNKYVITLGNLNTDGIS